MRYLIIGSEGFIGKNLVSQLLKNGDEVFGVDILDVFSPGYHYTNCNGDISNIEAILKDRSIDSCINAAGNGNLSFALEFPFEDYLMNCRDCFRLLDCIRRFQPRSIIFTCPVQQFTEIPIACRSKKMLRKSRFLLMDGIS